MGQISQMDLIKANIEYNGQGASNKQITKNILNEWRGCDAIRDMQEADAYYKVKNTAIDAKTRDYRDESGNIVANKGNLSNVKSKTARYRKSVNQKLNFSLSKPFVISCDNDKYREEWENFLNSKIRKVIVNTGKDAINKGIGWMYPWINEKGELEVINVNPETIYPAWSDTAHTDLDFVVRDYMQLFYNQFGTQEKIQKVEFWDKKIVEKYIDYSEGYPGSTGDLIADDENGKYELSGENTTIQNTHMAKGNGEGVSWDKVPFIPFKGNDEELPLLNECKTDIDGYDMLKSKSIDSLIDDIDPVIIIKDISADMGELARARDIIRNARIMTVESTGGAEALKVNTDISQVANELEIIKKDIQDNTSTVDLTTIQLGTNPSGNAMKSFFEALNTWCNGYESEFEVMMENLKYFFDKWLAWKGGLGTFEKLQEIEITFTLDRDMMINETEIIDNVVKLKDVISQETLDEMNPWIDDPEKEKKRREDDEKAEQEKMELYQFDKTVNEKEEDEDESGQGDSKWKRTQKELAKD